MSSRAQRPPYHVIPTGALAEWRDLPQLVRGRRVPGFLHSAFAPVGMTYLVVRAECYTCLSSRAQYPQPCHPAPNSVIPTGAYLHPCHPERSEAKPRDLSHRVRCRAVPGFLHFAYAPVGMTYGGDLRTLLPRLSSCSQLCHPTPHRVFPTPTMSSQSLPCHPEPQTCHPDWSVSGMEGSTAVGSRQEGARIPPLCLRSGRNDIRGIFAPFFPACHPAPNCVILLPTVSSRLLPCHPERSEAESRDLSHSVRCRAVPGFLHSATLRSE